MKFISLLIISFLFYSCGSNQEPKSTIVVDNQIKNTNSAPAENTKMPGSESAYQKISFKTLNGFKILKKMDPLPFEVGVKEDTNEEKNEQVNKQVPEEIKKLYGLNVEITGYAFPLKIVKATASDLVLMSVAPSCCFGDVLKINDLIYVSTSINKNNIKENQYIRIKGKLTVEMKQTEDKASRFLYWITADEVELAKPNQ